MDEEVVLALRLELKEWEREFAESNDGRKPGREDIKKNPTIAAKYKEYSKLKAPPPAKSSKPIPATPQRRSQLEAGTPQRSLARNLFKTPSRSPSKTLAAPQTPSDYDSPVTRRLRFGKDERTIDPTPQKTGRVLGLFDLLSPPKKFESPPQPIFATPSKRKGTSSVGTHSATPRKRKLEDIQEFTFSPVKRPVPETPDCLRRKPALDFNLLSSPPVPQPFKPPQRGLSKIVAELRALEDNAFADEEEAFRDIEEGIDRRPAPKKTAPAPPAMKPLRPSAATLDFDNSGHGMSNTEIPEELEEALEAGEEEGTGRVWKKKGLKRQTRRVKMRPVTTKSKAPTTTEEDKENDDLGDGDAEEALREAEAGESKGRESKARESKAVKAAPVGAGEEGEEDEDEDGASNYGDEGEESDYGDDIFDDPEPSSKKQKKDGDKDVKSAKGGLFAAVTATKEAVKKTGRKVKATAHANFKRLKIQSHMPKNRGRFGKRR